MFEESQSLNFEESLDEVFCFKANTVSTLLISSSNPAVILPPSGPLMKGKGVFISFGDGARDTFGVTV